MRREGDHARAAVGIAHVVVSADGQGDAQRVGEILQARGLGTEVPAAGQPRFVPDDLDGGARFGG